MMMGKSVSFGSSTANMEEASGLLRYRSSMGRSSQKPFVQLARLLFQTYIVYGLYYGLARVDVASWGNDVSVWMVVANVLNNG